jgi:hypothetical protein
MYLCSFDCEQSRTCEMNTRAKNWFTGMPKEVGTKDALPTSEVNSQNPCSVWTSTFWVYRRLGVATLLHNRNNTHRVLS